MITIRCYQESDAESVGRLIADTYGEFNLSYMPPEERGPFLVRSGTPGRRRRRIETPSAGRQGADGLCGGRGWGGGGRAEGKKGKAGQPVCERRPTAAGDRAATGGTF